MTDITKALQEALPIGGARWECRPMGHYTTWTHHTRTWTVTAAHRGPDAGDVALYRHCHQSHRDTRVNVWAYPAANRLAHLLAGHRVPDVEVTR